MQYWFPVLEPDRSKSGRKDHSFPVIFADDEQRLGHSRPKREELWGRECGWVYRFSELWRIFLAILSARGRQILKRLVLITPSNTIKLHEEAKLMNLIVPPSENYTYDLVVILWNQWSHTRNSRSLRLVFV